MNMYRGDISVGGVYAIEIDFNVEAQFTIEDGEVEIQSIDIYRNGRDVTNFINTDLYSKILDKTIGKICLG